eukprot:Colp12_sorted_trinity150504_noHs@15511
MATQTQGSLEHLASDFRNRIADLKMWMKLKDSGCPTRELEDQLHALDLSLRTLEADVGGLRLKMDEDLSILPVLADLEAKMVTQTERIEEISRNLPSHLPGSSAKPSAIRSACTPEAKVSKAPTAKAPLSKSAYG